MIGGKWTEVSTGGVETQGLKVPEVGTVGDVRGLVARASWLVGATGMVGAAVNTVGVPAADVTALRAGGMIMVGPLDCGSSEPTFDMFFAFSRESRSSRSLILSRKASESFSMSVLNALNIAFISSISSSVATLESEPKE